MESIKGAIRDNWYLIVILVFCVAGTALMMLKSGGADEESRTGSNLQQGGTTTTGQQGSHRLLRTRERVTEREKALRTISEHEETIEKDPESEDTPAYLNAMGNLYARKVGDVDKAIQCYELILTEHADWPQARVVYIKLADCYATLGDSINENRVYRKMMSVFPEDSQEHLYAETKLHGK